MANLTGSNFNNLKPGLLNIATNDIPNSKGLPTDGSAVFVEDGLGVKSGLKLGAEVVEAVEPTTRNGVVTVAFADRTYAAIEDVRLTGTAIELYRENTRRDFEEAILPLTNEVNLLQNTTAENTSRVTIAQQSIDSFESANVLVRIADLEDKQLSRLGGVIEGTVSIAPTGGLNMGANTLDNLADATAVDQAVNLSQLQTQVALLQAQIDALDVRVTALEP